LGGKQIRFTAQSPNRIIYQQNAKDINKDAQNCVTQSSQISQYKRMQRTITGDGTLVWPIVRPATSKRSWIQTQWCAGETPAGPLPMSLTWGVPRASQVRSAVILQKGKKRNAERCILLGFSV
jgi:hypothetical protein